MKNIVKIVDYYGIGSFHEMINTIIAVMCVHTFDEVYYLAGKSSCSNIRKYFDVHKQCEAKTIIFKPYIVYEKNTSFGALIRTFCGFFISLREYILVKEEVLLFNYTNPLSLPVILILNFFLKKKVIFTVHGELELQLKNNISKLKPAFWYKWCYKVSFKYLFSKNRAIILVLGDSIKYNLVQIYPNLSSNICSICHPYFFDKISENVENEVLTIGTVGVMKKEKGLESFIQFARELSNEVKSNKLIIKSIGKIDEVNISDEDIIQWIGSNGLMPRKEFEHAIKSLDYILFFYPADSYKLTASGAIMDAIKLEKPIIAIHNDYFDYLLKDVDIGYLLKDVPEMVNLVKKLIVVKDRKYYKQDFEKIKKKISVEENGDRFKYLMQKKRYII